MAASSSSTGTTRYSGLLAVANVLASQLNTALVIAGSFVITPAVLLGLGDSAYGGWLLINAMVGYMRLLDQGMSTGTMKYGAAAQARNDSDEIASVFNTSAAVFSIIGAISIPVALALAYVLPHAYASILHDASYPIAILGIAMAIDLFCRVYSAALRTQSLFIVCDGIELVTYTIFKLGLVLYLSRTLSYRTLAYITFAETLTRNAFVVGAAFVMCPQVRHLRPFRASRDVFRKLLAMSGAMAIIQVADVVRFQVDAAVIGRFVASTIAISIFGVGTRLPSTAYTAIGVIGAVLIPRFSGLSETGDHDSVLQLLRRSSLVTGLVSVFVLVNVGVFGPHFLVLWLKKPWVVESGTILVMMLPAYFIALLGGPASGLLVGRGKLRGQTVITVVEAILNLGLSIALVFPYGIYGVALGTIIPMLLVRGIVFPMVLHRDLGITPMEYARMHLPSFVVGGVYLALTIGFAFIPLVSYLRFVLLAGASTAIFIALLFIAIPDTRAFVRARLARRSGAASA